MMPLTREFKTSVVARVQKDRAFRHALLREGIECLLSGDVETGKSVLRDFINATIGFGPLAAAVEIPEKSLLRMFGRAGNPQAKKLFQIVAYLQKREGIRLEVKPRKAA
jgi:DNA-binding phage protein